MLYNCDICVHFGHCGPPKECWLEGVHVFLRMTVSCAFDAVNGLSHVRMGQVHMYTQAEKISIGLARIAVGLKALFVLNRIWLLCLALHRIRKGPICGLEALDMRLNFLDVFIGLHFLAWLKSLSCRPALTFLARLLCSCLAARQQGFAYCTMRT
jgi:hypothetical protein